MNCTSSELQDTPDPRRDGKEPHKPGGKMIRIHVWPAADAVSRSGVPKASAAATERGMVCPTQDPPPTDTRFPNHHLRVPYQWGRSNPLTLRLSTGEIITLNPRGNGSAFVTDNGEDGLISRRASMAATRAAACSPETLQGCVHASTRSSFAEILFTLPISPFASIPIVIP